MFVYHDGQSAGARVCRRRRKGHRDRAVTTGRQRGGQPTSPVPLRFGALPEQVGLAFVFESEAFAVDADDGGVMEDAIEHRHGQNAVAGEGRIPTGEGKIRGQDHRATLVALRHDLEVVESLEVNWTEWRKKLK